AAILHQAGSLLVLLNSMRLLVFGGWRDLAPMRALERLSAWIGRIDDAIDIERALSWVWTRRLRLLACGCAILMVGYAASGWTTIGPDQAGLLRRFGRYRGVLAPGLHPGWPWPIDQVTLVAPQRVHSLDLGFRAAGALDVEPLRWESTHGRQPRNRGDD